jgi:hypothetical protein
LNYTTPKKQMLLFKHGSFLFQDTSSSLNYLEKSTFSELFQREDQLIEDTSKQYLKLMNKAVSKS